MTVWVSLLLAVVAGLYTAAALDFLTSPLRLLPQRARYVILLNQYLQDFAELDSIIVVVEAPEPEHAKRYADHLVRGLRQAGLKSRITYRIDPTFFDRRGLLYLPVEDLTRLRDHLFDYGEFLQTYAARPTLVGLLEGLNQQFATAMALGFLDLGLGGEGETDVRLLETVVDQILAHLDGKAAYVSPWDAGFSFGGLDDADAGYYFSSDKRLLFVFVEEHMEEGDFLSNRARIDTIRHRIASLASEFPAVRAGVTGGPTIADDEMHTALRDSALATTLAATLVLSLLLVAYRRVVTPLVLLTTLLVSLTWALGIITLVVGHLSVFSVMFLSLVIGVGIDYGIYFLYRYQEEWAQGGPMGEALARTAQRTGPGILLGALTAAGTFFVLMLTEFQGIREFGLVSAIAILTALLAMLTLLPALLVLDGRRRAGAVPAPSPPPRERAESAWLVRLAERRTVILIAAGVLSAIGVWGLAAVTFEYNMLKLQARGVESVIWEHRMLASAGRSGFAAFATAGSLDELRDKRDAFARLPSVSEVESILRVVPDDQPEKIRIIRQLAPLVAPVRVEPPPADVRLDLRAPLTALRRRLDLAAEGIDDEQGLASVRRVRAKVDRILTRLPSVSPGDTSLPRLQDELYRDFKSKLERFQASVSPEPVRPGEAPPELRSRYVGRSGRYLLRIQPAVDIWQEAGSRRFIDDLRGVDPDVTGPPVTGFEATHLIARGYSEGTAYAFVLVTGVTLVLLRTVRGTVLALAPVALGLLWTFGVMRLIGLEFNLANVWALPLIIGTAAEYGLNIYVRFREGVERGGPPFPRSVVLGVVLSWLTTVAGFGSLMVAHHHGIFSLGLLLSVGSTTSLVASIFVLPVLLTLFVKRPAP